MRRLSSRLAGALACLCVGACMVSNAPVVRDERVLELTLGRPNGTLIELAALSGKPTLLFLFATYDTASQVALTPLLRFMEREPRVQVIGVALQPDAKSFLDLYKSSLGIPFELYFDPANRLLRGDTALGKVNSVPTFIALGASAEIRAQREGVATLEELQALVAPALR